MSIIWKAGIVRIIGPDGSTAGTGFVASKEGLIATCSHVVQAAKAQQHGVSPPESVEIVFLANGERRKAKVEPAWWRGVDAEDLAILRVCDSEHQSSLPEGVNPLPLGSSDGIIGRIYHTIGFPQAASIEGMEGKCEVIGETVNHGFSVLQLRSSEITRGFSGAPVWDQKLGVVVGMVSVIATPDKYGRLSNTAFATPVETLRDVCDKLLLSEICPYRGLSAFQENDANFFYGREKDVENIVGRLKRLPQLLAVLGPSGSGKSSLMQAGLIPHLRKGNIPESERWQIFSLNRPGATPLQRLEEQGLSEAHTDLQMAVRTWLADHPEVERLLLVIDQFEEVLADESGAQAFWRQLDNLIKANLPATVLLVLRDDFYARMMATTPQDLHKDLEKGLINVSTWISKQDLRVIVEKPAQSVGLYFEDGLVDTILDDAKEAWAQNEKGFARTTILPLLEFALTQLWEQRDGARLTRKAYEQIGYVTGALTRWADEAYRELPHEDQRLADWILTALVDPGKPENNIAPTRRRRYLSDICRKNQEQKHIHEVVTHLANYRLVALAREGGEETIELIHDALIWEWDHLRILVESNREFMRWYQGIEENASKWREGKGDLLRGRELAFALEWMEKHKKQLKREEQVYILESSRKERRRRLVFLGSTVLIILILSAIATIAFSQRNLALQEVAAKTTAQARAEAANATSVAEANFRATAQAQAEAAKATAIAETNIRATAQAVAEEQKEDALRQRRIVMAQQLATQSQLVLNDTFDGLVLSTLLAIESMRHWPNRAADQVLRDNLSILPRLKFVVSHQNDVTDIAFSPNGKLIASGDTNGAILVSEINSGQIVAQFEHGGEITALTFSPDSRRIASTSSHISRVWELDTSQEVAHFQHNCWARDLTFRINNSNNNDDEIVVFCSSAIYIWKITTGEEINHIPLNTWIWAGFYDHTDTGRRVASAEDSNTVVVREVESGKELLRIQHGDFIDAFAISNDGELVAVSSSDKTLTIWEVSTGREVTRIQYKNRIDDIDFSPDGSLLLGGDCTVLDTLSRLCNNGDLIVWEVTTGQEVTRIENVGGIEYIDFSPNGKLIANRACENPGMYKWSCNNAVFRIWDLSTGKETARVKGYQPIFSPDNHFVATTDSNTAMIWELTSGLEKNHLHVDTPVRGIDFSPDDKWILALDESDTIVILDATTGEDVTHIDGVKESIDRVVFSPNGKCLFGLQYFQNNTFVEQIWKISEKQGKIDFQRKEVNINDVNKEDIEQLSPRYLKNSVIPPLVSQCGGILGLWLSSNGWLINSNLILFQNDVIFVFDEAGDLISRIDSDEAKTVYEVLSSPGGKWIYSPFSDDDKIHIWQTSSGRHVSSIPIGDWIEDGFALFSPDDKWIITLQNNIVYVWNIATGKKINTIHLDSGGLFGNITFSPDSRWLLTWHYPHYPSISVWDIKTGKEVTHMKSVENIIFSKNGHWAGIYGCESFNRSICKQSFLSIWKTDTWNEIVRIPQTSIVYDIAFSSDEEWIVSANNDNIIHFWLWRPDDLIAEACFHTPRNLTLEEWNFYIGIEEPYRKTCQMENYLYGGTTSINSEP